MVLVGALHATTGTMYNGNGAYSLVYGFAAVAVSAIALLAPRPLAPGLLAAAVFFATAALSRLATGSLGYGEWSANAPFFQSLLMVGLPAAVWATLPWSQRLGGWWIHAAFGVGIVLWFGQQSIAFQKIEPRTTESLWVFPALMALLMARYTLHRAAWIAWAIMVLTSLSLVPSFAYMETWKPSLVLLAGGPTLALILPLLDKRPPDWAMGLFWGAVTAGYCLQLVPDNAFSYGGRTSMPLPVAFWTPWLCAVGAVAVALAWRAWKPTNTNGTQRALVLHPFLLGAAMAMLAGGLIFGERGVAFLLIVVAVLFAAAGAYALLAKHGEPSCPPDVAAVVLGASSLVVLTMCTRDGMVHMPVLFMLGAALVLTAMALFVGHRHPTWMGTLGWVLATLWIWVVAEKQTIRRWEASEQTAFEVWMPACVALAAAILVAWFAARYPKQGTLPLWIVAAIALGQAIVPITTPPYNNGIFGYLLVAGILLSLWAHTSKRPWLGWLPLCATAFGLLTYTPFPTIPVPDAQEAILVAMVLALAWNRFNLRDTTPWAWLGITAFWISVWAPSLVGGWLYPQPVYECKGCIYSHGPYPYDSQSTLHTGSTLGWFAFLAFVVWLTSVSLWYRAQTVDSKRRVQMSWGILGVLGFGSVFGDAWRETQRLVAFHELYGPAWTYSVVGMAVAAMAVAFWKGDQAARGAGLMLLGAGTLVLTPLGFSWELGAAVVLLAGLAWSVLEHAASPRANTTACASVALGWFGLLVAPDPIFLWAGVALLLPLAAWLAREGRHTSTILAMAAGMALALTTTGQGVQPW